MTDRHAVSRFGSRLPDRVRLLVLGGGCHGVGVLHDMASRGWQDIHLIERSTIGAGTSSRSTKLIHGGLRYLQHVRDFPLVAEALRERQTLMKVAPDLVKPIELLFPVLRKGGVSRPMIKIGLSLYDFLAGRANVGRHQSLHMTDVARLAPMLNQDLIKHVYQFWDCQMDDLALVNRVATSAVQMGAGITEGCAAIKIRSANDGFEVDVQQSDGTIKTISALYVFNALGPWSNDLLTKSQMKPTWYGFNNRGAHLVFPDLGLKAGLFLQSPDDGRIFFVLPWKGQTLVGTTEERHEKSQDDLTVSPSEVNYLLERCNRWLNRPLAEKDIVTTFCGLRWLAADGKSSLTATSRAWTIDEQRGRRGLLLTLYGGKWSTYRALAETIGNRITTHFGEFKPTRTKDPAVWHQGSELEFDPVTRFDTQVPPVLGVGS